MFLRSQEKQKKKAKINVDTQIFDGFAPSPVRSSVSSFSKKQSNVPLAFAIFRETYPFFFATFYIGDREDKQTWKQRSKKTD